MQAHNGNPWLYLKDNANPEVVEAVAKQDDSFGAGVFGLCAVREGEEGVEGVGEYGTLFLTKFGAFCKAPYLFCILT